MKISKIYNVNKLTLLSTFIFFICIKVSYLSLGVYPTLLLKVGAIVLLLIMFLIKQRIPKAILLISGWYLLILFSTIVNSRDVINAVNSLTSPYLISLFLAYYSTSEQKRICVLETWTFLLLMLCLIDAATMIVFPNGMATDSYYALTWFLGYKTARLVYSVPLVVLWPYLSYLKKGALNWSSYAVIGFCVIAALRAQATGAAVSLLFYLVLVVFGEYLRRKGMDVKAFCYKFLNYKIILIGYSFIFVLITVIQTNPLIQYIIQEILHKSSDLSHRTGIWMACLERFYNNPIIGNGYLTNAEYILITDYQLGTSPHSFGLSILVTVGLLGLLYYAAMLWYFFKKQGKKYEYHEMVVLFGYLSILILGLASSVMTYAVFSTFMFQLIGFKYNGEIILKRRLLYERKK